MTEITEMVELDPDRVDGVGTPANGVPFLLIKSAEEPAHAGLDAEIGLAQDAYVRKFVSAAQRRRMARTGVAMPNGDFPIPDEGHLRSAIGRLAEYKGNRAAAKRHIIARARALGLVHLLPKEWHVKKQTQSHAESLDQTDEDLGGDADPVHEGVTQGDGDPPAAPYDQPRPPVSDGRGDVAPHGGAPVAPSLGQTHEVEKAGEAHLEGSQDAAGEDEKPDAEETAEHQTDEVEKGPADSEPGSPEWEKKDVHLGERAEALVRELGEVVHTFTDREKAEGGSAEKAGRRLSAKTEGAIRACLESLTRLLDDSTPTPATKEALDMTPDELLKLLDEHATRRAEMEKKAAKKAAKKDDGKGAKKGAKKDHAAKSLAKLEAKLGKVQSELAAVAATPGRRVTKNAAGLTGSPEALAKGLAATVESARTPAEERAAREELVKAKLMFNEELRERSPGIARTQFGPGATPLFIDTGHLRDDATIRWA